MRHRGMRSDACRNVYSSVAAHRCCSPCPPRCNGRICEVDPNAPVIEPSTAVRSGVSNRRTGLWKGRRQEESRGCHTEDVSSCPDRHGYGRGYDPVVIPMPFLPAPLADRAALMDVEFIIQVSISMMPSSQRRRCRRARIRSKMPSSRHCGKR